MTPQISNDELLVLYSLITKKPTRRTRELYHDQAAFESLVQKGFAKRDKTPTNDGRWKYVTMCDVGSSHLHQTPERVIVLMQEKGLW